MTTAISKTDRATEAPASVASTGWFSSFFGWATTILAIHALVATACWLALGVSGWWPAMAAIALGAHLIAFAGMCFMMWAFVGGAIHAMNDKLNTEIRNAPRAD
jgi:hypothetical protein